MLIALVVLSFDSAKARTIEIKMSECPKPLLENVRNILSQATRRDVVVLNFDKAGTYEFDGSIRIPCNAIIKGVDSKNTRVIVKEGVANGKSKMLDDTFFKIVGTANHKVKAEVHDIRFELASHKGTLWETAPKHIVKVNHGDGLKFDNVSFYSTDAVITHLDLRQCSNVVVENCLFENYNNCREGGCLWSRGNQRNLVVKNNIFYKYGQDEALGVWGGNEPYNVEMRNILVDSNKFYYENKTKCKTRYPINNLITFCHFETQNTKYECDIDSIVVRNNDIEMREAVKRDIKLVLDKLAKVGYIEISGNNIINTSKGSIRDAFMMDFEIRCAGQVETPIIIKGNHVKSNCEVLSPSKDSGYSFAWVSGSNVEISDNVIESEYPLAFINCKDGDVKVKLENNQVGNLCNTAIISSSTPLKNVTIQAYNNEFTGDTRIYCRNVDSFVLDFQNNIFNSTDYHFFLQESAAVGSIVFKGNTVNAKTGKGIMVANYTGKSYKFSKLNVTNNVFNGLTRSSIEDSFKNVKTKDINNNIYR